MIFLFQYLATSTLPISNPMLPFYPPIGIAFSLFYLFGNSAAFGLLLGGFLGFYLQGLSMASTLLYLSADLGAGFLGAMLCQKILSSDISPFANLSEFLKFLKTNTLITCLLSSALRMTASMLDHQGHLTPLMLFYYYINLWLADLNTVLILSGLLLSWVYVPFSREKISDKVIGKIPMLIAILYIICALVFMKNIVIIYLILAAMIAALYAAYYYGYLIAMALLFIISTLYLAYFSVHGQTYIGDVGLALYTTVPGLLFLFSLSMFYLGHIKLLLPSPATKFLPLQP